MCYTSSFKIQANHSFLPWTEVGLAAEKVLREADDLVTGEGTLVDGHFLAGALEFVPNGFEIVVLLNREYFLDEVVE